MPKTELHYVPKFRTVVAAPTDGRRSIPRGPNLATAGTGDLLTGLIVSLIAQGCLPEAALAGSSCTAGRRPASFAGHGRRFSQPV